MDIIDRNVYNPKRHKGIKLDNAYKELFKESVVGDLVIQDLLTFSNYNQKFVSIDPNMQYYIMGQQSILGRIKDFLNSIEEDEAQLPRSVEEMENTNE